MNVVHMKKNVQSRGAVTAKVVTAARPPVTSGIPGMPGRWEGIVQYLQRDLLPPVLGLLVFIVAWAILSTRTDLPSPLATWHSAMEIFSDPFIAMARMTRASAGMC